MKTYLWPTAAAAMLVWITGCEEPVQAPGEPAVPDEVVEPVQPRTGAVDAGGSPQRLDPQTESPLGDTSPGAGSSITSPSGFATENDPREEPPLDEPRIGTGQEGSQESIQFGQPSTSAPNIVAPFSESPATDAEDLSEVEEVPAGE